MADVNAVFPWVYLALLAVIAVVALLQLALTATLYFRLKRARIFGEKGKRRAAKKESASSPTKAAPESPGADDVGSKAGVPEAGPGSSEESARGDTVEISLSPLEVYGQLVGERDVYRTLDDLKAAFDDKAARVAESAGDDGARFREVFLSCRRGIDKLSAALAGIADESKAVPATDAESKKAALRIKMTRALTGELLPLADKFLGLWGLPEKPDDVFGDGDLADGFREIRDLFLKSLPAVGIYPEDIQLYETKWDPKRVYEIVGRKVEEGVPPDTIVAVERWLFRDRERRAIQKGRVVLSEKPPAG